ncbi:MAG: hypothetical protein LUG51_13400 [Tannerellaceae bacterium]|nr:hypothetical protein [Tannerellaceae bacterium]
MYTSLRSLIPDEVFKNDDFWKICIAEDGVYFQSFTSIYRYDYSTVEKVNYDKAFLFLHEVRGRYLVQEINSGLLELKGLDVFSLGGSEFFYNTDVRVILPYGENEYLIGAATKGLYLYDGISFRTFNPVLSDIMKKKELNCAILSSKGTYFLGTILDGIYEIDKDGEILNHISSQNSLQNNTILALYEDNRENIWAALDRGISYIQYLDNMSCITEPAGNTGAFYDVELWQDKWFLGTNQGVFYIHADDINKPEVFRNMKLIDGTQGQVWKLKMIDGKLFCCHNRGIKEIRPDLKVVDNYSFRTGINDMVKYVFKGREVYLFSTYNSLKIALPDNGETFAPQGISEPISATFVDHLNNIWLEHPNKGVYRCQLNDDLQSYRHYTYYGQSENDDLPYKLSLFKVGGRIALLGNDSFLAYDDIEDSIVPLELLNNCFRNISGLQKIVNIDETHFWALAQNAVYRFYYDGYEAILLESYHLGLNLSLVHGFEHISVINDSIHMICLDNGILYYKNRDTQKQVTQTIPSPYLSSLEMMDLSGNKLYHPLEKEVRVPYAYNSVNFYFIAPDIYSSSRYFQYKLKSVDPDWSEPVKKNSVTYPRLSQGKYEFLVRTVDYTGNYSEEISLKLEVLPPWYRSYWAYILYVTGFILLAYGAWLFILWRYRNQYLHQIRMEEMKRLQELTGELQDEVERKNAELLTQTSFIINKNELILKLKDLIDDFYSKNKTSATTQFYQKINSHLNNNMNTEDDWKMFLIKFEEKHTNFFKHMKTLYPELTSNDLRLCACLKLNLETKEIASLMNLSVKAVENNRYRLRKKIGLTRDQNLNDVFVNI